MLVYDVNTQKTFENLDNWRDEFLIQVCTLQQSWALRANHSVTSAPGHTIAPHQTHACRMDRRSASCHLHEWSATSLQLQRLARKITIHVFAAGKPI